MLPFIIMSLWIQKLNIYIYLRLSLQAKNKISKNMYYYHIPVVRFITDFFSENDQLYENSFWKHVQGKNEAMHEKIELLQCFFFYVTCQSMEKHMYIVDYTYIKMNSCGKKLRNIWITFLVFVWHAIYSALVRTLRYASDLCRKFYILFILPYLKNMQNKWKQTAEGG